MGDETHDQLSALVVKIVLPFFTFYVTATSATPEALSKAPALIWMGVVVVFINFGLATLFFKPAAVGAEQQRVFRFGAIVPNTAFVGYPICLALFGPLGLFYAVVHDFGASMLQFTLGIWDLSGGRVTNWRSLVLNPLIWSLVAGVAWRCWDCPCRNGQAPRWNVWATPRCPWRCW